MISPCISECGNNGEFCPSCGRTMKEKFDWKNGADQFRKKQILQDSGSRLTQREYEYWKEMYEIKVAKKLNES